MNHGLALLLDGNWDRARVEFERILEIDPKHGASWLYLGFVECVEGAPGRARDHLEKAVEIDPELVNGWLLLGLMAESEEDFAEAERYFTQVAVRRAQGQLANQRLAFLAAHRGEVEEALPYLRAWAEAESNETAPLLHLSATLTELGQTSEAADLLDRALALEPDAPALHRRRGDLARTDGEKQEAAAHYRAALAAEPDDVETRIKYGVTLITLGDPDGAISSLEQAVDQDPDRADAHYELGVLYYTERSDVESAMRELDAALALEPNDATARMIRQEIELERGRGL